MATYRRTAVAVGVLFFVATASYIAGSTFIGGSTQVRLGVLLEFIDTVAAVGIAVLLFPVLRKVSESAALGYLTSRIVEAVLIIVSALGVLAELPQWYGLAFQMALVVLGLGSLALCYALYAGRLVPRILSLLGFVGYAALFISGWLTIFGSDLGTALFAPGALFEIIFPLWLIIKGFDGATSWRAKPAAEAVTGASS